MTGGSGSPGQRRRGEGITLFSNPRFRGLAGQLLLVGLIVWLGYAILSNAAVNLEKQHISSGFGFLDNSAGFGIVATLGSWLVGYSEQSTYGEAFLVGLINTLAVAALAIVLATI
ncbi:MAG: amino acid ABC transporter permease, partial [Rhodobiaceae bacterium]|nr:amino acid ABC transporter permease [Rhodobiaceae bacterium]